MGEKGRLGGNSQADLRNPDVRSAMAAACGDVHPDSAKDVVNVLYSLL